MYLSTIYTSVVKLFEILSALIPIDSLGMIALIALIAVIIFAFFLSSFSIEIQTSRAVNRVNSYLEKRPFINDDNLVEFNKLMKTIPKPMRYQWQQYMLNREQLPSNFLTQNNCIERPFKSSSYEQAIVFSKSILAMFTVLLFIIGLADLKATATSTTFTLSQIFEFLLKASVVPAVLFVLGEIAIIFLRARRKAVVTDLYYNFDYLTSNLDKAVETIPAFVDYEILFSKKEIKQGIPALQDYLEQRAAYEQDQLEKAKASAIEHDKYDFAALNIDGSLVMERAMRESEYYLGNRRRLLMEIEQLEGEKDSQARAYTEASKGLQRKLRDVKESLERLRDSLENATNKIDSNYIRKQQADEVKKQQTLEKEMSTITNRFNKDIEVIDGEIAKRNGEIEEQRNYLEKAMSGEFQDFAKKTYDQLNTLVEDRNKEMVAKLKEERQELEEDLDNANTVMVEKEALYREKLDMMKKQDEILKKKDDEIALKETFIRGQNARIRELESGKVIQRYFDANGNEFFYDEEGNPYYRDANGNMVYYDGGNVVEEKKEKKAPATKAEPKKEVKKEEPKEEPKSEAQLELENLKKQLEDANKKLETQSKPKTTTTRKPSSTSTTKKATSTGTTKSTSTTTKKKTTTEE
ncbi:MAG: hypothetical protein AB7S44_01090 [Spirochaetales bacterium]